MIISDDVLLSGQVSRLALNPTCYWQSQELLSYWHVKVCEPLCNNVCYWLPHKNFVAFINPHCVVYLLQVSFPFTLARRRNSSDCCWRSIFFFFLTLMEPHPGWLFKLIKSFMDLKIWKCGWEERQIRNRGACMCHELWRA